MVRVLPIHFGMVLGCQGGGGKNLFRSRKVFSGAGLPNRAKGQIFHHGRAWKVILAWYSVAKEAGGREKLSGPESLFLDLGARTRQHRQDKPRQANTSQGQPPRSDDLQWVRLVSGWSCRRQLGDHVRIRICLGLHHVCHQRGSSALHNLSFGK